MSKIAIIIPARIGSQRLPRKPLLDIGGHPMLYWAYSTAKRSQFAERVVIATDSTEIVDAMEPYGAQCIMTSADCQSGSDRVYQASQQLPDCDVVVNLQGDEPLMSVEILDSTITKFLEIHDCQIATPAVPFAVGTDPSTPSLVKVVYNRVTSRSIYFSRAAMADSDLHLGLYVYRRCALEQFCQMPPSRLEQAERLEQLRAIEAGMPIHVAFCQSDGEHFGIDTPADLERVRQIYQRTGNFSTRARE